MQSVVKCCPSPVWRQPGRAKLFALRPLGCCSFLPSAESDIIFYWCGVSQADMQPLLIINLTDGRGAARHAAGAPLRTTVIIWPPSGLFPSLRLSLLLSAWWSTARVSIKHLGASACLIHSSPAVRPAVISFSHESPQLISPPPFWHTPPYNYYDDHLHITFRISNTLPAWSQEDAFLRLELMSIFILWQVCVDFTQRVIMDLLRYVHACTHLQDK